MAFRKHHENNRRTEEDVREVVVDDAEATEYVIKSLEPFTRYFVSIQVINPEGVGPSASCTVSTDEGGQFQFPLSGVSCISSASASGFLIFLDVARPRLH